MKALIKYLSSVVLVFFLLPSFGQEEEVSEATKLLGELTPIRENFDVQFYDLAVELDISNQSISGQNTVVFTAVEDIDKIQIDLHDSFTVESITQHNKPLKFERKFHSLFIDLENKLAQGDRDSVMIKYSGKPPVAKNAPWDDGFIWTTDSLGNPWVGVTAEGTGAHRWWPNKDHLSDEPEEGVQVAITVPSELKGISNGRMIGEDVHDNGKTTYTWRTAYSVDNYNVTLYVGNYVHYKDFYEEPIRQNPNGTFSQNSTRTLDIDYYILSYNVDKAKEHFTFIEDVLNTFEYVFGPYPFYEDGFAVVESPYLGMEHQGAIGYGNDFMMGWKGQLVKPYIEFDYLFVHETGHEWWGNNVSVKDRADMWIQEGLTTYGDAIYVVSMYGYKSYLEYMEHYKSLVSNEKPIIGNYGANEDIPLDAYYKAALMLNTLSQLVEDNDKWLGALRKAQQEFKAPRTVTTQEFESFLEEELKMDLKPFFDQYLRTTMIPKLQMKLVKKGKEEYLIYRWTNVVDGFNMPVQLEYGQFKQKWIYPEQKWKKVKLPRSTDKEFLKVDDRLFYIDLQMEL